MCARQYAQYAACVLPVCQKPELGLQLGFDRFRLSKIRYDRLRSGLYAAIVRLRLSTGAGRNTMAVDAGGGQIAVALTAPCRTPVANLGIFHRRKFLATLGGAAAWPLGARAQQPGKLPTIGYLGSGTPATQSAWVAAFVQRLPELGSIEGRTVAVEYRWAEGATAGGGQK